MKYPNNINKEIHHPISYSNRGMDLEEEINESNDYYIMKDKAYIYKKPTPIGVSEVSYHKHGKVIEKGYFKEQSTLDYNGLYRGKYIEFEAKVTQNKSSFPLANIHDHQIKHVYHILKHGGTRKSIPYEYIKNTGFLIKYGYRPILDYLKIIDEIYFREELIS